MLHLGPGPFTKKTSSEEKQCLAQVRKATGYVGKAIVDLRNVLAKEFKRMSVVDVAITKKKGYEFGMAQPAVFVVLEDGTVLES